MGAFQVSSLLLLPETYTVTARLVAEQYLRITASNSDNDQYSGSACCTCYHWVTTQATCAAPRPEQVSVTTPDPTMEYSINGTTWVASGVFTPVAPGTYTVTARLVADNTCVSTASNSVTINTPAPPAAPAITVTTQATCAAPTGTVSVTTPDPTMGIQSTVPHVFGFRCLPPVAPRLIQ